MRQGRMRAALALLVMAVAPVAATAGSEAPSAADDARSQLAAAAAEAGMTLDEVLAIEIPMQTDSGEDVPMTVEELVARLENTKLQDPSYGGIQQTPELNAGNVSHVFVSFNAYVAPRTHTPDLSAYRYTVTESDYSPDTPIVPVINPLLAVGNPGGLPPVLGFHAGGRLKNVQAKGYTTGYHSAGTTLIGSNVDTRERTPGANDTVPVPVYAPFVHPGTLTLSDKAIDFVGYAQVVTGGSCTKVNIPFTSSALFTCAGGGLLLGDGATNFNGGPVNLRSDVPVIWDPSPVGRVG